MRAARKPIAMETRPPVPGLVPGNPINDDGCTNQCLKTNKNCGNGHYLYAI